MNLKIFFILKTINDTIKIKIDKDNIKTKKAIEIDDAVTNNLSCECLLNVGVYLKTAPSELNGCSGCFIIIKKFTHTYSLNKMHENKKIKTISDLQKDVENIKNVLSKIL
ncbi:hypothetical protein EHP00_2143 [Ecytonucleospora hepatopenaei]|uniref:Uncharacterized protein n=1 Tax=Ecytonucleospora hepatopenaei TaxID=646526 RepID=A0A1W0E5K5_9MICR|nr:hypothetical protein EHP00_2143 [Ecytonucleospora hepatopenaei]